MVYLFAVALPAILVLVVLLGITGSAILCFWWAADSGQFKDPGRASECIFDRDEPVGRSTDQFPDSR